MWFGTLYFDSKNMFSYKYEWIKNSICDNVDLTTKNCASFVKVKLSQCVKSVCIQLCTCSQKLRVLGQSQNMCNKVSSAWLQKEHRRESTIFLVNRKWPVGKVCITIYVGTHRSHDSYCSLKIAFHNCVDVHESLWYWRINVHKPPIITYKYTWTSDNNVWMYTNLR